jgi:hypothetical protein
MSCVPTGDDAEAGSSSSPAEETAGCHDLIGADGIAWSERTHGAAIVESSREVQNMSEAVERFRDNARAWTPQTDDAYFLRSLPAVCRLVPEGVMGAEGPVTIKLGPGTFPYEELVAGKMGKGTRVTESDSGLKFVAWAFDEERGNRNSVYVKCQVEGAMSAQAERVAIEVTMTDNLPQDADRTSRFAVLLDAAQVAVKKAECLNKPRLPEYAPERD